MLRGIVRKNGQRGFTLVELLVVIAIIGVLATLVLLQLGTARSRSRDTKRITDVNQLRTAVEQYFEDHAGKYPTALDQASIGTYMTRIPMDPLDSTKAYNYAFDPAANPTKYQIWTTLEQSAAALGASAHMNSTTWGGGTKVNASGVTVAGCAAAPNTAACIYDQGIQQ
jgi:prepilin-type N-terminal cleavage/methylation domain-containing protein